MPRRPAGLERPTSGANRSDRLPSHGDFIGLRPPMIENGKPAIKEDYSAEIEYPK